MEMWRSGGVEKWRDGEVEGYQVRVMDMYKEVYVQAQRKTEG